MNHRRANVDDSFTNIEKYQDDVICLIRKDYRYFDNWTISFPILPGKHDANLPPPADLTQCVNMVAQRKNNSRVQNTRESQVVCVCAHFFVRRRVS